jgi:hypothetical protein
MKQKISILVLKSILAIQVLSLTLGVTFLVLDWAGYGKLINKITKVIL